jgi:hypothetical protein
MHLFEDLPDRGWNTGLRLACGYPSRSRLAVVTNGFQRLSRIIPDFPQETSKHDAVNAATPVIA